MRKKHLSVLYNKLSGLKLGWLFSQAFKYASIPLASFLARPLTGPIFGGLVITYGCNMKCTMCDLWRRHQKKELSTSEWKKIIDQFARLGVGGIGISGGEPMLRKDIFELIKYIRQNKKIPVSMSTNGFLLTERGTVEKLFSCGLDSIAVSLDSTHPEIHDHLRGLPGAYERAVGAIKLIREAKKSFPGRNINLSTVITRNNINDLTAMVSLGEELGVDGVSFLPGHTLGIEFDKEEREGEIDIQSNQADSIEKEIDRLIELKKRGSPIDNSVKYLRLLKHFFKGEKLPVDCLAGYTSYYVDALGDIYPCFAWLEMKRKAGNVKDTDLVKFWKSCKYNKTRLAVSKCRDCYFSCQIELGLMYHYGNF